MARLLEQVEELDGLIHQLEKMEGKMQSGRWLDVHRECCRLIAAFKRAKRDIIENIENEKETEEGN